MPINPLLHLRRSKYTLLAAALVALTVVVINEAGHSRASSSIQTARAHHDVISELQFLLRSMADAETGQRGFLLTDREDYLRPYRNARGEVERALASLRSATAQGLLDAPEMATLEERVREKLSELETTLELHATGRRDQWHDLLMSNIGKEKMDEVRSLVLALLARERRDFELGQDRIARTLNLSRFGVNLMAGLALLALALFLRKTRALDVSQAQHAQALLDERDRLEAEVRRRTAEPIELAQHLQTAVEDERSRLARELHDELGALLTAAKLDAARLKRTLGTMSTATEERLASLSSTLNSGIALKRRIIEDLRPSALSNLGLEAALDILAREFAARAEIEVRTTLRTVKLDDAAQITAYRFVQEAFTNIAKYARASHVDVQLADDGSDGGLVRVTVSDDGVGFDPRQVQRSAHGLSGMRYRVRAVGGTLELDTAPGRGTRITIVLPALATPAGHPAVAPA